MKRLLPLCLPLLLFACTQVKNVQVGRPTGNAIPALHVFTDSGQTDLRIASLAVDVRVLGNTASTTFDITFYNNLDRVLEGELDFPLADGQTVCCYALEVNGQLRQGVVVEKAAARVAYQATVRKGIDPGLVEKTKGANFRTRVYPIPAKGYKRVVIGIAQTLSYAGGNLVYQLPLQAPEKLETFSLAASVAHGGKPLPAADSFPGFSFRRTREGYGGTLQKKQLSLNHLFAFAIPVSEIEPAVYTETENGKTHFYAFGPLRMPAAEKEKPSTVALLWDISASAGKRNHEKEIAFLKAYFQRLGNAKILLVPFHIAPLPPQEFSLANGDATALLKKLESFSFDGGTQLGTLRPAAYPADEYLLFSDGLSTFGKSEMPLPSRRLTTVSSSPSADYATLKFMALQTGGQFVDLSKTEADKAAAELQQAPLHVTAVRTTVGSVNDVATRIEDGGYGVSGVLNGDAATIDLEFGFADKLAAIKTIRIEKDEAEAEGVSRLWAAMQIEELERQPEKNRERITALGKTFSVVSSFTSLLVLDRVEDYVEHEILPPRELREEYFALLNARQGAKADRKRAALEEAVQAMNDLKAWYNASVTGRRKERQPDADRVFERETALSDSVAVSRSFTAGASREGAAMVPPPPPPPRTPAPSVETGRFIENIRPAERAVQAPPGSQQNADRYDMQEVTLANASEREKAVDEGRGVVTSAAPQTPASQIDLAEWKPDAIYLKHLDAATKQNAWTVYQSEKKNYGTQPAFYFDVARWFFDNGRHDEAILVLSNVVELKLESPEMLRMMAYQLLDMSEKDLAVETFREVLRQREEEPQAYRDLALALGEVGGYPEALSLLYKVATGVWDERFSGLRTVALDELNSLIGAHRAALDLSGIDTRLVYAMPLDVRITIDWNTDNSDVDLWVTDPQKEKCYYENTQTAIGGRISRDMTQGYGPEEFAVKKAVGGEYVVEANLYGDRRQTLGGPITIRADLFTNYGRPNEQHRRINFRVTEAKEVVRIGSLKFG